MAKRKNTLTRFFEDIVDDTKDFVDDILDRCAEIRRARVPPGSTLRGACRGLADEKRAGSA